MTIDGYKRQAGGIGEDVKVRDVVLAMGASTNAHFADQYRFPGQLCATADYGLLKDAAAAAERLGVRADVGQVFTSDQFYNCLLYTSGALWSRGRWTSCSIIPRTRTQSSCWRRRNNRIAEQLDIRTAGGFACCFQILSLKNDR